MNADEKETAMGNREIAKDKINFLEVMEHIENESSFKAESECGYPCTPDGCLGHDDDVTDGVYILAELLKEAVGLLKDADMGMDHYDEYPCKVCQFLARPEIQQIVKERP